MAINFGRNRPWGALSVMECQRRAKDPRHPLVYRVHFAAIGWANQIGHAEFGPGELSQHLKDEGGKPLNATSLSRVLGKARDLDLVAPSSQARCLVLAHHVFQKERYGNRYCKTHGIKPGG
ncbi:hypothetical protein ACQPZX_02730 [Actinoplanes sp. CA-142083]|uniref:hypothetical protein n=1 Tax=Actinoplanes sp. CA-142083 TaxID=3239903 RepID=UPI003D8D394F